MTGSRWDALVADLFDSEVMAGVEPVTAAVRTLHADECGAVADAVPRRRHEFAAGRACARRLLARFDLGAAPLPVGTDGRPQWPAGIVGSIAHAGGLCVAALARRGRVAAIGIDVEVAAGLEEATWDMVCTPRELDWLRRRRGAALLVTAMFSAKESVYKCLVPGRAFEPLAIELEWDGTRPAFGVRASPGGGMRSGVHAISGAVVRRQGWIFSGATRR